MNIAFVYEGKHIRTPMLSGAILRGVTRDSLLKLAPDLGYSVTEDRIDIRDVLRDIEAVKITEAFGIGTVPAPGACRSPRRRLPPYLYPTMWCTRLPIFRFLLLRIAKGGLFAVLFFASIARGEDNYAAARREMVREIERMAASTPLETGSRTLDRQVLEVMGRVQRHLFVPAAQQRHGYENRPLPIGNGQTISQPYIVGLMTDLLRPEPGHVVLEIGTGSGYQAAVLAELTGKVYTMEIIEPLGIQAKKRLAHLGYRNVEVEVADGYYGWPSQAPFDGIIVTAAASHVPVPLVQQLKPGGRMVIPVGPSFLTQQLMLIEKRPDGSVVSRQMLPVRFVPFTGMR